MTGGDPFDSPLPLVDLIAVDELGELVAAFAQVHGCGVGICDPAGQVLAASTSGPLGVVRRPIQHEGEPLGWVAVDGAAPVADHVAMILERLVHHARARRLTGAAHEAIVSSTFAELGAKHRRLEAAVARMRDADRVKTNFLATVSHELRTPLTSVIGYSEMLLEGLAGPLSEPQRDYVTTILGKAEQLLQLITAMLDMSRADSPQPVFDAAPVDLAEILATVVDQFKSIADKRGIALALLVEQRLAIRGDRRQIHQVVWSLVSNAVKFTLDGGHISVALRLGATDLGDAAKTTSNWNAIIAVRDDGIGIPADRLTQIFEPFFQVDSSSTREYGGSGLGLALAKVYVEAHGGWLEVESTLGQGSSFVVGLPMSDDDARAAAAASGAGRRW